MHYHFLILFFILSLPLQAQKIIKQVIENTAVKTLIIRGDSIFKINISTSKKEEIYIQSQIDGEYASNLLVLADIKDDTLYISSTFIPFFEAKNDKLSVHKVISIELSLVVPENLTIYAKSAIASAQITGKYNNLTLEFSQGNTTISSFTGNATVNSINGNIAVQSNYAVVKALSRTGSIVIEDLANGINQIKLNSINGNISVTKTKK